MKALDCRWIRYRKPYTSYGAWLVFPSPVRRSYGMSFWTDFYQYPKRVHGFVFKNHVYDYWYPIPF